MYAPQYNTIQYFSFNGHSPMYSYCENKIGKIDNYDYILYFVLYLMFIL